LPLAAAGGYRFAKLLLLAGGDRSCKLNHL
jgi:hypothetical protein